MATTGRAIAPMHVAAKPTPNPSLKRSANGRSPGPVWRYAVHFRQPGPGVLPSSPGLCGHFKIRAATLSTAFLSIECLADKWTVLRIHYPAAQDDYKELVRIISVMFEDEVLHFDQSDRKLRGPT